MQNATKSNTVIALSLKFNGTFSAFGLSYLHENYCILTNINRKRLIEA